MSEIVPDPDGWETEFQRFERVLAVAVLIAPRLGDEASFRLSHLGRPLLWFNETSDKYAALCVPYTGHDSTSIDEAFAIALRWMTLLKASHPAARVTPGWTLGLPLHEIPGFSPFGKPLGGLVITTRDLELLAGNELDDKSRIFWAQVREADSSESAFVRCLWLYKAIEYGVVRGLRPELLQGWVDKVVAAYEGAEPFDKLAKRAENAGKGAGDYLENECRHAVAHVTREDRADPDDPQEYLRINEAVNALEALVQIAQDCGKVARPAPGTDLV